MNTTLEQSVSIPLGSVRLLGDLHIPSYARGIVVFAHGSGSSRHSPRNRFVGEELNLAAFGTLLFDLLTEEEDKDYNTRFDIDLLTQRLVGAVEWLRSQESAQYLPVGIFGASTGAAAALCAAARLGNNVSAVVSRGGRPDLASRDLKNVLAPTLLIVGGNDEEVMRLNQEAMHAMDPSTVKRIEIIHGATHLFEEVGAIEKVSELAADWFLAYSAKPIPVSEEC